MNAKDLPCVLADQFLRQRAQVGDSAKWPFAPQM
jgi:hypothetical protein